MAHFFFKKNKKNLFGLVYNEDAKCHVFCDCLLNHHSMKRHSTNCRRVPFYDLSAHSEKFYAIDCAFDIRGGAHQNKDILFGEEILTKTYLLLIT